MFKRKPKKAQGLCSICITREGASVAYATDSPSFTLKHSEFIEADSLEVLTPKLAAFVEQHKLAGMDTALVLRASEYRLFFLDAPNVPEEERSHAAKFLVKDLIDYPLEDAAIDVFEVPKDLNDRPCEQIARHVIRNSVATGSASMIRRDLLRQPQGIPPQGWLHDRWWSLVAASHCGLRVDQEPVIDYRVSLDQQIGLDRGRQATTGPSRLTTGRLSDLARLRDVMALHQHANEAARRPFTPTSVLRSLIS